MAFDRRGRQSIIVVQLQLAWPVLLLGWALGISPGFWLAFFRYEIVRLVCTSYLKLCTVQRAAGQFPGFESILRIGCCVCVRIMRNKYEN